MTEQQSIHTVTSSSSSRKELWKTRVQLFRIAIIGIFFIAYGTGAIPFVDEGFYQYKFVKKSQHFFTELGIAFVIGWILSATVEHYNRLRHEDMQDETQVRFNELAKNITRRVAYDAVRQGVLALFPALTPKVIGATQQQVLAATVARENYQILVEFEVGSDFLLMKTSINYKVRNVSKQPRDFRFAFSFEPELRGGMKRETQIEFVKIGADEFRTDEQLEKNGLIQRKEGRVAKVCRDVVVPSESEINVVLQFREKRELSDSDYWVMTTPTDGLSITIASWGQGLQYFVDALHPEDADEVPGASDSRIKTWDLPHGLLPGQGILLRWRCNSDCAMI